MMTDPFETVREALEKAFIKLDDQGADAAAIECNKALAALEKIKERWVPDGYGYLELHGMDDEWQATYSCDLTTETSDAPTINSAVTNAIKAIGER